MKTIIARGKQLANRGHLKLLNLWMGDEGIETIEWVALGAVLAVAIGAIMALASDQGKAIGTSIFTGIKSWADRFASK